MRKNPALSKTAWSVVSLAFAVAASAGIAYHSSNSVSAAASSGGGKGDKREKSPYTKLLEPQQLPFDAVKPATETEEAAPLSNENGIYLNSGTIDVTTAEGLAMSTSAADFSGSRMRLVKFRGPIEKEWYESLVATGVEVIDYIPNNAYLVYGDAGSFAKLNAVAAKDSADIVWQGDYTAAHRVDPSVRRVFAKSAMTGQTSKFAIQLYKDRRENAKTLALVDANKLAPVNEPESYLRYVNVVVSLSEQSLDEIAARPDVISIQPYLTPVKLDERQDLIVSGNLVGSQPTATNYMTWLASKGFTQSQFSTSNFVVDVSDSGIDNGTATPNHFGLYTSGNVTNASRVVYNRLEGTANAGSTIQGCDGHGNLNSHIIGGFVPSGAPFNAFPYADAAGYRYGIGVAPFVKVGSSVIFDPGTFTSPNYENLQSKAYNDGARISSNSWGSSANTYTTDSQRYDALVRDAQPTGSTFANAGNQQMVIVFAAGNAGSGANTVGSPSTGKNVITVGASEGVQAFGAADQCGTADADANSAFDIVGFSSRGPTSDGRKKPDIVAPGTHISGGVAQTVGQLSTTPAAPNGSANTCFDATGVCAGPGTSNFFPIGQQWYTASSGTSHSTPAVAGGAALIRQHFLNVGRSAPSPAMTKAVLTNGARYMNGNNANDNLYSNNQGMGLMDLNKTLDGVTNALLLRDQDAADKFTATGQTRVFNVTATSGKLMRITLVWTDAPGATTGSAVKNNLNLSVVNGANTYLGNVFTGQLSVTGGTADALNNVESVYLPSTASGTVAITVTGANINSDAVPGDADALDQDFAIIVTEVDSATLANVVSNGVTLTAESFAPANNAADPGETVTVNFNLQNTGVGSTTNLVATLLPTGGVTNPSAAQTYGAIAVGGNMSKPFTFVPTGACGSTITLSFRLQDGAIDFGTVTATMRLGVPPATVVLSQNFDAVTAPALPAGWTAAVTGSTPPALWATTATTPDTAPNAVFTNGVTTVASNSLVSPSIALPAGSAGFTLSFRQTRNFEGTSTCFDGGVVELSTNGGTTFNNVTSVAVGGVWTTGGYNGTVSPGFSNPVGGQAAFCFQQGTYVTSTLTLPGSLAGQNVILRWRAGWDSSTVLANPNWRIDGIVVSATPPAVCSGTTTTMTVTSSQNPSIVGQPVTFTANVSPVPSGGTVDFFVNGNLQTLSLAGGEGTGATAVPIDGSGNATFTTNSLPAGTNTVTARFNGTSSHGFSTAAVPGAGQVVQVPTAGGVRVEGVVRTTTGRPISFATVRLTSMANGETRTVRTNSFGRFAFDDVAAGFSYTFDVSAKRYRFASQVMTINDGIADLVFTSR